MNIFILLVLFQFKHFIADYLLQTPYHLKKFLPTWDFFLPLVSHCCIHSGMTLAVVLFVNPALWWLCIIDFIVHFIMDRIKAGPKYLGRYKALSPAEYVMLKSEPSAYARQLIRGNTFFWWSLGLDQMVHHLTDIFIIFMLT